MDIKYRSKLAKAFLEAATIIDEWQEDVDAASQAGASSNVIVSLASLSGIAAADAICGKILGVQSSSSQHQPAIKLLRDALRKHPDATKLVGNLSTLVNAKNNSQYSAMIIGAKDVPKILRAARNLVEAMQVELDR